MLTTGSVPAGTDETVARRDGPTVLANPHLKEGVCARTPDQPLEGAQRVAAHAGSNDDGNDLPASVQLLGDEIHQRPVGELGGRGAVGLRGGDGSHCLWDEDR